jgi:hypothetical protein
MMADRLSLSGPMLLRKIKETKIEAANHDEAFCELDGALARKRSIVEEWKIEVEKWEDNPNDTSVQNPFITRVASKWSLHHDVKFHSKWRICRDDSHYCTTTTCTTRGA